MCRRPRARSELAGLTQSAQMAMALSAAQLAEFEERGFVTVDTPLTEEQLDEAEAAWDRVKSGETDKSRDHAYLDTITHPFFEDVAKQVLRAPAVQLLETNPHDRPPGSGATSWSGGHLDVQITRSGWDATPRREMLAVWLWCNGVPHNRGAMRVLPGSHLPIADHWERTIRDPAHLSQLPRVHGLSPGRAGSSFQKIPECSPLGRWADQTPVAAVAKRGQCLVFSQAILHSAWQNEDSVSRKAYIMSWTALGVPGFLETSRITNMRKYHAELRAELELYKPERAHIVSAVFNHGISEYGNKDGGVYWEEMLLPDDDDDEQRLLHAAAAAAAAGPKL